MTADASEKPFKVMKWLRETRDRIYEETKDLSPDEELRYYARRPTDPVLARMFDRRKVPTARGAQGGIRTPMEHANEE